MNARKLSTIAALAATPFVAAHAEAQTVRLFWFAGQSNMVGGNSTTAIPDRYAAPNPDVMHTFRLNQISDPDGWGDLAHHHGVIGGTTFGPDLSFGHTVAQSLSELYPDDEIAIIKTAHNGTALARQWMPGSGHLFEDSLSYVLEQAAILQSQGYEVQLEGFFWVQGYADLGFQSWSQSYGDNLAILMESIRESFGDDDLPIYFTRQHIDSQRQGSIDLLRDSQEQFAASDLNSTLIDIDDLGFRDEGVHYDGAGTIAIGERFAQAYLNQFSRLPTPGASLTIALAGAFAARRRR